MEQILSRQEASGAVQDYGWRFLLGTLRTSVRVRSLAQAMGLAADTVAVCGDDADRHLRVDVRPDRVVFTLQFLGRMGLVTDTNSLDKPAESGHPAPEHAAFAQVARGFYP
ncbi:hypothetical protein ACFWFF_38640, partial [Streptomyces sp. NPDC060223]